MGKAVQQLRAAETSGAPQPDPQQQTPTGPPKPGLNPTLASKPLGPSLSASWQAAIRRVPTFSASAPSTPSAR
eukprot:6171880-Pleurochrysis_carterae.AAC.3